MVSSSICPPPVSSVSFNVIHSKGFCAIIAIALDLFVVSDMGKN